MQKITYRRVLLKLSGEALKGEATHGLDPKTLAYLASEIGQLVEQHIQIGIVIGGGNLCRGQHLAQTGLDRITGDQMDILATVMNALAMRDSLEQAGHKTALFSAVPMVGMVDTYDHRRAMQCLSQGQVVFFAGGTGNPLVTTDSAAALRAIEISADLLIKATKVDGVYSEDPIKNPKATFYTHIGYSDILEKQLKVMDRTAFFQCQTYHMPICIFNINKPGALLNIVQNKPEGTFIDAHTTPKRDL